MMRVRAKHGVAVGILGIVVLVAGWFVGRQRA